jgi:hypothetical protein
MRPADNLRCIDAHPCLSQRRHPRFDRLLRIHTEAGADRPPYDADGAVERRKFGGPIEVMPGEPRAGITEDVLAEMGYRGFSMREHMVTVAQKRVRDRAG